MKDFVLVPFKFDLWYNIKSKDSIKKEVLVPFKFDLWYNRSFLKLENKAFQKKN